METEYYELADMNHLALIYKTKVLTFKYFNTKTIYTVLRLVAEFCTSNKHRR